MNSDVPIHPRVDDVGVRRTGGAKGEGSKPLAPTGFILELPTPPSVNSFERDKRGRPLGNRSSSVQRWFKRCDAEFMALGAGRPRAVAGDFELEILWERRAFHLFDIDNRVKPLLDLLQRWQLVENDRNCWRLVVGWGAAPKGCIVKVKGVQL